MINQSLNPKFRVRMMAVAIATSIFGIGLTSCASTFKKSLVTPQDEPVTTQARSQEQTTSPSIESPQTIKFKTQDGWTITGDLYRPSSNSKGLIVLLHQRGGSAKDWQPLATALQLEGFTALAIDQRGAGDSTQGIGSSGKDAPWLTTEDIAAAVANFSEQQQVGLIGASYGANNALIYAAAHPQQIRAVALFSPGANYNGLDAITAARLYRGSLAIYHSKNDSIASNGPEQINRISIAVRHKLLLVNGSAHGSDLLTPKIIRDAINFFKASLATGKPSDESA